MNEGVEVSMAMTVKEAIATRMAAGHRVEAPEERSVMMLALWILLGIYAAARVLAVLPTQVPMPVVLALHIFPPGIFALLHGGNLYRVRGILVFTALCLSVGNIFENLGVLTGFPFGHYYFTDVMGPKLFQVPILIGPAYLGMGYLSWILARLILGNPRRPLAGSRTVTAPLLAAFVMVAWDLSCDPVWSTIKRCWIWKDGGAWFGVPVSNFLGWYLTVFVFYQLFALYLRRGTARGELLPAGFWRLAVLFYAVCAVGNVLLLFGAHGTVSDSTGRQWKVSVITSAGALVSIFIMGAFAVLAWRRTKTAKEIASCFPGEP